MDSEPTRPLRQRTIGILGGMSNQATGEYYRLLNERLNARLGGWDNGEIVVASVTTSGTRRGSTSPRRWIAWSGPGPR